MKQIFIFGTDKTFTVILFSVLHDVITYGVGIFIDESSANFLVHKQYAFVIGKLKQIPVGGINLILSIWVKVAHIAESQ